MSRVGTAELCPSDLSCSFEMILSHTEESSEESLELVEAENPENELLENSELESAKFSSARNRALILSSFLNEISGEESSEGILYSVPLLSDFSSWIPE
jgi:hypothetical protein